MLHNVQMAEGQGLVSLNHKARQTVTRRLKPICSGPALQQTVLALEWHDPVYSYSTYYQYYRGPMSIFDHLILRLFRKETMKFCRNSR